MRYFIAHIQHKKINKKTRIMNDIQKINHFSMTESLKFWDNFDYGLYVKILKAKSNE